MSISTVLHDSDMKIKMFYITFHTHGQFFKNSVHILIKNSQ